jgi:hypothetical protein
MFVLAGNIWSIWQEVLLFVSAGNILTRSGKRWYIMVCIPRETTWPTTKKKPVHHVGSACVSQKMSGVS